MAQIPLGGFSAPSVQAPVRHSNVDNSGAMVAARALEGAGQTISGVAEQAAHAYQRKQEEDRQEDEALSRAKAANALTDHELHVRALASDVSERLRTGALDYNKAGETFREEAAKIPPLEIPGLPPALAEHYQGGLKNNALSGELLIDGAVKQAKRDDFKSQFASALDANGKLAGLPGADIAAINAKVEAFMPLGRQAGLDDAVLTKAVQDFKDRNWTNQAIQRSNSGHDDPAQLRELQKQLTDEKGYYADKLDPEKRNALAGSVGIRIDQLEAKAEHLTDKREAIAERAVGAMENQIASGYPPKPEDLAKWQASVQGTSQADAFNQAIGTMQEVQEVLRKPQVDQDNYLQTLQSKLLTQGGSVKDKTRYDALSSAIEQNKKQMAEAPLLFLQNRTGVTVEPIDFGKLAQGDVGAFGKAVESRMASLTAAQKQFGPQVQLKPLLPQEAKLLVDSMSALSPDKLNATFGLIRQASGSDDAYQAVMKQIAPNAPVKAYAGQLAVKPGGELVSALMLRGEALLNTKEGQPKFPMPSPARFEEAFAEAVGDAYQGRPKEYQRDLEAMRAVYAGSSARDGDAEAGTTFSDKRAANAIRATIGSVSDYGGRSVLPPWGMPAEDFDDKVQPLVQATLKGAGMKDDSGISLINTSREGVYVLARGRVPVIDPNRKTSRGQPAALFIDLNASTESTKQAP